MFGHDKDENKKDEPVINRTLDSSDNTGFNPTTLDDSGSSVSATNNNNDDAQAVPLASTTGSEPEEGLLPAHTSSSSIDPDNKTSSNGFASNDLLSIKRQALEQLTPLVRHLDQSPEERFKTLMMMIQADDNQDLIKDAYEAAQQITDEKAKAQALLDVVNEINYFTQQQNQK